MAMGEGNMTLARSIVRKAWPCIENSMMNEMPTGSCSIWAKSLCARDAMKKHAYVLTEAWHCSRKEVLDSGPVFSC